MTTRAAAATTRSTTAPAAARSRTQLRALLDEAILEELHRPLPSRLVAVQERALGEYYLQARQERERSELSRLNKVERIVRGIERQLP